VTLFEVNWPKDPSPRTVLAYVYDPYEAVEVNPLTKAELKWYESALLKWPAFIKEAILGSILVSQ
jgi:hypothetical protein